VVKAEGLKQGRKAKEAKEAAEELGDYDDDLLTEEEIRDNP
jgi:hypothetical protein